MSFISNSQLVTIALNLSRPKKMCPSFNGVSDTWLYMLSLKQHKNVECVRMNQRGWNRTITIKEERNKIDKNKWYKLKL